MLSGSPTTLQTFPQSYLYLQYNQDPDLQALVSAFNQYAQFYLNAFNALNLPIYTQLTGALLDWVGTNLYGINRPVLGILGPNVRKDGQLNTYLMNTTLLNSATIEHTYDYSVATDDQYKRIITWNFYKGDGFQFNVFWLKRRVIRFLTGSNGIDPGIANTYLVSVAYGASETITITVDSSLSANAGVLQQAIAGGFLQLPFKYLVNVIIS